MISEENLKQLREMIANLLEEYGLKKPAALKADGAAERMRRYRDRRRNARVAKRNAKRNASPSEKRNSDVTPRNADVTAGANGSAVAYIPLVDGREFGVSAEFLIELEAAYPEVDGPGTLREIRVWCLANPAKRKTERGVARFINGWFERLQNHG